MSVLESPRIMFRGRVSFDPIVTNNYMSKYDEEESRAVFDGCSDVAGFRQAAIESVSCGNWNPHGTHRTTFYDTFVVSVDAGSGASENDPFVKSPVSFTGMLVDLDPYGSYTPQIFFDSVLFGVKGGCEIYAPRQTRMTARYINFHRNSTYLYIAGKASVVWQTSFPKSGGLRIATHDSPILQQLNKALADEDVQGLTIRWNAYRTLYFNSLKPEDNPTLAKELRDMLHVGGFQPNPARSEIVGVIGLWRRGEPASEPGDRALLTREPTAIATASAKIQGGKLTLDLGNSIPETGVDLVKQDLGRLTVAAVSGDGQKITTLGSFDYQAYAREAYERQAGIITLNIDSASIGVAETADLQVRREDGSILLAEKAVRAVPCSPNIYLDEGETTILEVLVLDRGVPVVAGVEVTMTESGTATGASVKAVTDAAGIAKFPLKGAKGGVEGFIFRVDNEGLESNLIDPQVDTYVFVRTLPADDDEADLEPTWQNVYRRVLRNWEAMAPCMDNWLRLGVENEVLAAAKTLRRLTEKGNIESYRYMPVTRDLTAGQRTLLHTFLGGGSTMAARKGQLQPQPSLEKLSRAMRQWGSDDR